MRELVLDELARLAGTTGRNVRAFQTQGLLPRPRLVGRRGVYDEEHLERLRAVLRLQGEGFSLASIALLFRALDDGRTLEEVVGLPGRPTEDPSDDDLCAGWPAVRHGRLLSAAPSTLVAVPAA